MKRYISIDHIYVEKLAELCGESFYNDNSYNLLRCERLHEEGWSWKVIYFALLEYRTWYDKQWNNEHLMSYGSGGLEKNIRFGKNVYDSRGRILDDCLVSARDNIDKHMVAEEFFFRNMKA